MTTEKRTIYELTWHLLSGCFNYEHYAVGIEKARQMIQHDPTFHRNWIRIVSTIENREFTSGQPLKLVNHGANQVLDINSDEEAYFWLDKMILNLERTDGEIDVY